MAHWHRKLAREGGGFCCYCKRGPLLPAARQAKLSFTRDHVQPQVDGGKYQVPCCRQCNHLKGALAPNEWFWFIDSHPRYWKTHKTHGEVAEAVRAERIRRVRANATPLSAELMGHDEAPPPTHGKYHV